MKKRMLSLVVAVAMLMTAIYMPVSASVGKLPADSLSVSDDIIAQDNEVKTYTGAGSTNVGFGSGGNQHSIGTYTIDADSAEYYGAVSFRVKADENNRIDRQAEAEKDGAYLIAEFRSDSEKIKQINTIMLDYTGYIHSMNGWQIGKKEGVVLGTDWHTVGVLFKKDLTFDVFIDGVFQQNIKLADADYSNTSQIKFLLNVSSNAKYYFDEFTWKKFRNNSFIAANSDAKTSYSAGNTIKIEFSEIIASYGEVKLYNVATGEEVSGLTSSYDGQYLNVTLPEELTQSAEYRIEMNDFVGAFGRELETDNIYFNCAMGSQENGETIYLKAETFANYKNASLDNYVNPKGWYLKQRWNTQKTGFVVPTDSGDSHGTVMKIGKTGGSGEWSEFGVYLPFGEKISAGLVTICYDVKPIYLSANGNGGNNTYNPNLFMMVYPDAIPDDNLALTGSGNDSWIQKDDTDSINGGLVISGISGGALGNPLAKVWPHDEVRSSKWNSHKTFATETTLTDSEWCKVKVEIDYSASPVTMKWYLNGELKDTSTTLASALGLSGGIAGLSFGGSTRSIKCESYIDNVSVSRTISEKLGEKEYAVNQDFDNFENNGTNGNWLWDAIEADGVEAGYGPNGWGVHQIWANTSGDIMRQYGNIIRSTSNGKDGTNALKIGKQVINAKSMDETPTLYYRLDETYDSGVVEISYDIKAEKLAGAGNTEIKTAIQNAGGTLAGWGLELNATTPIAPRQFDISVVQDELGDDVYKTTGFSNNLPQTGSSVGLQSKNIFGIQNNKLTGFTTPRYVWLENGNAYYDGCKEIVDGVQYWGKADYREDMAVNTWYSVMHKIDFENGVVTSFVNDVPVSIVPIENLEIEKVTGLRIGGDSNMYGTEIVVDNVFVRHAEYVERELAGGVMQVRFSDYYGNNYGSATTHTTLTNAIGISFWVKDLDEYSFDDDTVVLINTETDEAVDYTGDFVDKDGDSVDDAYVMVLDDYLTKNTTYKLVVNGVTSNGVALPAYEQLFTTDEEGVVIVEPMVIKHNGTKAENGVLAENDTVTASVYLINTTGEEKDYAFSMGVYEGGVLRYFDFEDVSLDGRDAKSAELNAGLTISASDATIVTKIKTFLWDGMTTMNPVLPSIEFNATQE